MQESISTHRTSDEISQDLELDFDLVRRITAELKKDGCLEVV
jgi:hypothetical protein